jgi:hypothetical protein
MPGGSDLLTETDCQNCGLGAAHGRGRTFRVRTLEGFALDVCGKCLYIASPFNDPARMPVRLRPDPTDDDGRVIESIPCEESVGERFTVPDEAFVHIGHMYYGLDIPCPSCGRVFAKLPASKAGTVRIPRHSAGPV